MTEDLFNLILRIVTYDGSTEYSCFDELIADEKNAGQIAINAMDIKRLIYTAYNLGIEKGKESED